MAILTNILITLSKGIPGMVVAGLAMILMFFALIRKEAGLMTFAALLTIPLAYAMGAWAGFPLLVRLLPIFPLLSAFAISKDETLLAWILPSVSFVYLVYTVFKLISSDF